MPRCKARLLHGGARRGAARRGRAWRGMARQGIRQENPSAAGKPRSFDMRFTNYGQAASGTHPSPYVRRDSALLRLDELRREAKINAAAQTAVRERLEQIEAEIEALPTERPEAIAARIAGGLLLNGEHS
jgi:hypothetical protein